MTAELVVDQRRDVSLRARVLFGAARLALRPLLTYWPLTTWGMRPLVLVDRAAQLLPAPREVTFETVDFGGFQAEWARAGEVDPAGAVLYFHGGAFVVCGLATHRHAVSRISAASGLPVLSVGYRHLPVTSLSGSVDDCVAAYRFLLDQGIDPRHVVFAGDSAGGHLAFATALRALAEGLPRPAGIVALSPWLDFDIAAKMAHPNALRDAYAPVARLPQLAALCAPTGDATIDPSLSPVNGHLGGLPPVLIMAAESEMLLPDAELMATRLSAADVPCTLQIWAGQVHAFPVLANLLPESMAAITEIGAFVRRTTEQALADAASGRRRSRRAARRPRSKGQPRPSLGADVA
ncbi:MAG TPA: alpha/beta hydrolase [Pseudonocardiaceae bacterium]|jgi:acetyl esterase/lipase|nr:alpha/beta hydrolase [Pseudonocardiaceae bacterium]